MVVCGVFVLFVVGGCSCQRSLDDQKLEPFHALLSLSLSICQKRAVGCIFDIFSLSHLPDTSTGCHVVITLCCRSFYHHWRLFCVFATLKERRWDRIITITLASSYCTVAPASILNYPSTQPTLSTNKAKQLNKLSATTPRHPHTQNRWFHRFFYY